MNDTAANVSMFATILAAVDGSERSPEVVRAAAALAHQGMGHVHLFRSVTIPQEFPAAARMPPDKLPAILMEQARRDLEELAAGYSDIVIEEPAMDDPPQAWRSVLKEADRLNADLIVIGSHGFSGWDHVLGTTAAKVVNHAHRNVFVVHERRLMPEMASSKNVSG